MSFFFRTQMTTPQLRCSICWNSLTTSYRCETCLHTWCLTCNRRLRNCPFCHDAVDAVDASSSPSLRSISGEISRGGVRTPEKSFPLFFKRMEHVCPLCSEELYAGSALPIICNLCFNGWCKKCARRCLQSQDVRCPFCRVHLRVQYSNLQLENRLDRVPTDTPIKKTTSCNKHV